MLCLLTVAMPTLSGCGHVSVKDEILYFDEGPSGAHFKHFLTSEEGNLDKSSWDDIREGYVCMSSDAFGDFKKEIEQLCTKVKCDYTTLQALEQVFAYVEQRKSMLK